MPHHYSMYLGHGFRMRIFLFLYCSYIVHISPEKEVLGKLYDPLDRRSPVWIKMGSFKWAGFQVKNYIIVQYLLQDYARPIIKVSYPHLVLQRRAIVSCTQRWPIATVATSHASQCNISCNIIRTHYAVVDSRKSIPYVYMIVKYGCVMCVTAWTSGISCETYHNNYNAVNYVSWVLGEIISASKRVCSIMTLC